MIPFPLSEDNDATLVAAARSRDQAVARRAYDQLVRRHERAVRALLHNLCRVPAQADDLAQDTFLKAWQALKQLREPSKFAGWVKRMAYREFLHAYRRQQVEHRYVASLSDEESMVAPVEAEDLERVLGFCDTEEAELLVLSYAFGFKISEIAKDKGMAEGTVKSLIHRAKKKIQQNLPLEVGVSPSPTIRSAS